MQGGLQPVPIVLTATSPYGHWWGLTTSNPAHNRAHLIELTRPRRFELQADRGVLLHEMAHQALAERGDSPAHEHGPWCEEIMRLHHAITGKRIWVCPEKVTKLKAAEPGGKRKSVRVQPPDPQTGEASLGRDAIARWPHSVGLDIGTFI